MVIKVETLTITKLLEYEVTFSRSVMAATDSMADPEPARNLVREHKTK